MSEQQSYTIIEGPRLLKASKEYISAHSAFVEHEVEKLIQSLVGVKLWPWSKPLTYSKAHLQVMNDNSFDLLYDSLRRQITEGGLIYLQQVKRLHSLAKIAGLNGVKLTASDAHLLIEFLET